MELSGCPRCEFEDLIDAIEFYVPSRFQKRVHREMNEWFYRFFEEVEETTHRKEVHDGVRDLSKRTTDCAG